MELETQAKIVIVVGLSVLLGPFFSLIGTPIVCWLRMVFYVPLVQQKYLKKAIEKNHVVQAKLVSSVAMTKNMRVSGNNYGRVDTNKNRGTYVYEYKGKKYKRRLYNRNELPEEETLYFLRKPSKATIASSLGYGECRWFLIYLGLSFILGIVTLILGALYVF